MLFARREDIIIRRVPLVESNNMQKQGIIAVWKPKGPTSHDIVDTVRRATGERRVGHAGTLDPLAEGILVIGIGKEATTSLSQEVAKEKEYVAKVRLGAMSTTEDDEGEKKEVLPESIPTEGEVKKILQSFIGKIDQIPPAYSALKIKGTPAYKLARKGKVPEMKSREVEIKEIELLGYEWPNLSIRVVTGPGVYIRSLARDIGFKLGTAGYLSGLIRTRVGEFTKEKAIFVEELKNIE